MSTPVNGVFSYTTSSLDSGEHLSRLSLRFVLAGQQSYRLGRRKFLLDSDRFLVINHGRQYQAVITPENGPVTALGVAFNPRFASGVIRTLTTSADQLLEEPEREDEPFAFFEQSAAVTPEMRATLLKLKCMLDRNEESDDSSGLFAGLLAMLVHHNSDTLKLVKRLPAVKASTRAELFRRVSTAREMIAESACSTKQLGDFAQVAALSEFHFARLFRQVYGITPHQYRNALRLEKAKRLLQEGSLDVNATCLAVGFTSTSSFIRLFRSHFGITPGSLHR
jgi:AraC family transcriptional regulator